MAATTFSTDNSTYRQLLAGGNIFQIPRFQRDYSWGEENWDDLWSDIQDLVNSEDSDSHYMGYLVLQSQKNEALDIIDGQQRMTTLSILVLAVMRKMRELIDAGIDPNNNTTRLDELRRTYIGQLDAVSLQVSPKITLNRNNDHYYQTYLVTLRSMPARGFKESEHNMRKATDWFSKKISEYLRDSDHAENQYGEALAQLVNTISRGLFFTVITVDDELNAYKVFETLNARGVKLAAPDLLKNYLFSIISREATGPEQNEELDKVEQRWSNILERLQSDNITAYLRTYWGAKHSFVRQTDMFKVIKRSIGSRGEAYQLIGGLEEGLETFLGLSQPDLSGWDDEDKNNARLLKMFSVRQPFALLMAAKENIPTGFSQILRGIVNITFRYNVISNLQPAEQERTYSRVAIGISKGELGSANEVLNELRSIYPKDDTFKVSFTSKIMDTSSSRNKQIVKYILAKIDAQMTSGSYAFPGSDITIEHILPESPGEGWAHFDDAEVASEVYRLGNMTLLESKLNRDAGNLSFDKKVPYYEKSKIHSTCVLASSFDRWDNRSIERRQNQLAKVASGIWRVPQFH